MLCPSARSEARWTARCGWFRRDALVPGWVELIFASDLRKESLLKISHSTLRMLAVLQSLLSWCLPKQFQTPHP